MIVPSGRRMVIPAAYRLVPLESETEAIPETLPPTPGSTSSPLTAVHEGWHVCPCAPCAPSQPSPVMTTTAPRTHGLPNPRPPCYLPRPLSPTRICSIGYGHPPANRVRKQEKSATFRRGGWVLRSQLA